MKLKKMNKLDYVLIIAVIILMVLWLFKIINVDTMCEMGFLLIAICDSLEIKFYVKEEDKEKRIAKNTVWWVICAFKIFS